MAAKLSFFYHSTGTSPYRPAFPAVSLARHFLPGMVSVGPAKTVLSHFAFFLWMADLGALLDASSEGANAELTKLLLVLF